MNFISSKIGLIGLAVMGQNLARNIARNKFRISVFNRTTETTNKFIKEFGNEYLVGAKNLKEFVDSLEKPRKIILLVQAGKPVDAVIENLKPLLDSNDIIIDLGNSYYKDTQRRFLEIQKQGFKFIGSGVSGGEEGALNGPSLMPGGDRKSWLQIKDIFEKISAKDFSGNPCVTYIGDNGAGHFVKMVHNGIEYGVMQMMSEAYDILRKVYKLKAPKIAKIFQKLSKGKLNSYLFDISMTVLSKKDELSENNLIDMILDKASQKGTGSWTAIDALQRGVNLSSIAESVFARCVSGQKDKRMKLSKIFQNNSKFNSRSSLGQNSKFIISLDKFVAILENALYCGMLSSYAQGFDLIQNAMTEENWQIDLAEISRIWEGGCIIRAEILNFLHKAFLSCHSYGGTNFNSPHLFEIDGIKQAMENSVPDLRELCAFGILNGIAMPSLTTALSYFDSITSEKLPANFIQGLRDYFGAHTYERIDKKGAFHSQWNG
ncbi:hypothetical protein A2272_00320 [Candidatus Peregrinibacteria bacterium RIFOXYA12_FULL_33_12]|nr:MAG: hypothetical protein A2272_00320 [Candidatus Peregrinibacteria bacterium RIFOXYA12_FULL_33_12]OGJ44376.1 MAG: hypothetical protein A2263_05810 [Candidatus Peregrinibacteria bacterium RIFOXYA2_FULL_33_21]OGJ50171.1 MAG: hypothetical protein A2307_03300 [Candidatus Peregrinibacteria bacterium RIFOXYB2_FULL_33_20]